jgi:tRNA threonylcarbamoyladenosine biosynthesis protein TsaB
MLLAVDTSTAQVGLAAIDGNRVVFESVWYSVQHHTIELAPALREMLQRAGFSIEDLEAVAVAIGPGSFTALRVGLALTKGLAVARNLPIVGVPTLDVLAAGQPPTTLPLAAVLQAGRGRIAVAWYKATGAKSVAGGEVEGPWVAQGDAELTTVDALAKSIARPTIVAGELTHDERLRFARKRVNVELAPLSGCVRRPSILAEIGWVRYQAGKVDSLAALAPIYLHISEPIPA